MAKVITTELLHSGASGANVTLDSSKNVTFGGNVSVTGTLPADKLTGNLPAISGASLTGIPTRTTPFRNLLQNGAFQVAQRGTSSTNASYYHTVDRWAFYVGGHDEVPTQEQVSLSSSDTGPWEKGFRKAFKLTNGNQTGGVAAGDQCEFFQEIEAQDLVQSNWNTRSGSSYATLSFWIKSSVAQNFYGYLRTNDNTKQLYAFETGSLSANTWTKVTKQIPGHANLDINNDNGAGMVVRITPWYGTDYTGTRPLNAWAAYDGAARTPDQTSTWWTTNDATLAFTGFQLEAGSTATDFEHISYGAELDRCERFYQVIATDIYDPLCHGAAFAGDMVQGCVHFHKPFRAEPSMVKAGGTDWLIFRYSKYGSDANASCGGDDFNLQQVSETMANIRFTGFNFGDNNTMGAGGLLYTQNASASLAFSADL